MFQWLLTVLRGIADRHGEISLATVAQAWVLSRRRVAGVIIGLTGKESHLTEQLKCKACLIGTYSEVVGATAKNGGDCLNCPAGTYGSESGAGTLNACLDCDVGKYSASHSVLSLIRDDNVHAIMGAYCDGISAYAVARTMGGRVVAFTKLNDS